MVHYGVQLYLTNLGTWLRKDLTLSSKSDEKLQAFTIFLNIYDKL